MSTRVELAQPHTGLACKQSDSLSAAGSPYTCWLGSLTTDHWPRTVNIIEHTTIIQTHMSSRACTVDTSLFRSWELMIIQQVGSALSTLNKTKNVCSGKSIYSCQIRSVWFTQAVCSICSSQSTHSSAYHSVQMDIFMSSFLSLAVVWEGDPPLPPLVSHS